MTGKEKKVHTDHTKVVPESCCSQTMNQTVRTPHPALGVLNPPKECKQVTRNGADSESDDELICFPQNADGDEGREDVARQGGAEDTAENREERVGDVDETTDDGQRLATHQEKVRERDSGTRHSYNLRKRK